MNGHITGGAIVCGMRSWFASHPKIASVIAHPFLVSLLLLCLIILVDLSYEKNLKTDDLRTYIQHYTTALIVLTLGFSFNNNATRAIANSDELTKKCGAGESKPVSYDLLDLNDGSLAINGGSCSDSLDDLLSQYVA